MLASNLLIGTSFEGWRPPFRTREDILIRILSWVEDTCLLLDIALKNYCGSVADMKPSHFSSMADYAEYVAQHTELSTKIVLPPVVFTAGEHNVATMDSQDQSKCLYVMSELMVKHRMLLDYVVPIDLYRVEKSYRTLLNHPHECRLLTERDGHFVCQIRAVLNRMYRSIQLLRSLTGDMRSIDKTPDVRHTRFHGSSGQRYTLGVVYKTRELMHRVKTVLERIRLGISMGDSHVADAPCALYAYPLLPVDVPDTFGEIVVPNYKKTTQSLAFPIMQIDKKVHKVVMTKYPVERGKYGVLPDLFDATIPIKHQKGRVWSRPSEEFIGLRTTPAASRAASQEASKVQQQKSQKLPILQARPPRSSVYRKEDDEEFVGKYDSYVHGDTKVLHLGRNRYKDYTPTKAALLADFKTPGPNAYDIYDPSFAPAYTMGKLLPGVVVSPTPGFAYIKTNLGRKYPDKSKELMRLSRNDSTRKKKLLVSEWYDYQRRHKYFPRKFDHFSTNRIIKDRVIRYPPNVEYPALAHAFPGRAMPCAPSHLPAVVKTLVLP